MLSLVFSDLHLDARTCGLPRYADLEVVLDKLCEAAHQLKVDRVVHLGDLCDPGPGAHRCVARVVRFADALPCPSVWLTGNHDVVEDGNGASVLEPMKAAGYTVIDSPTAVDRGRQEIWLPYVPRARAYDPSAYIEKLGGLGVDIVAVWGHLNLEGIVPGSETDHMPRGRDVFWPMAALDKHYPGVPCFGGHYHRAQEYKGVRIVGASARFTFGEEDSEPRYLLVNTSGKRARIASFKLPSRRVYSIPVEQADEVEEGDIVRFVVPPDHQYDHRGADAARSAAARAAACTTIMKDELDKAPAKAEQASAEAGESYEQAALRIAAEWETANANLTAALRRLVGDVVNEELSR